MSLLGSLRAVEVTTPLADDILLFSSMSASESLGRPFELHLELLSESESIDPNEILGRDFTVRLDAGEGEARYFHGLARSFRQVGTSGEYFSYQATVVPWVWFLTRSADCRIFQSMTAPEIIKEVFREHGFTDFEESLQGTYRTWDYCVQYRETAFNFVHRLLEQEGIYYYFKHEEGKHTLMLSDAQPSHSPTAGYEEIPYFAPGSGVIPSEHISEWSQSRDVQPGTYAINDFDFTRPRASLEVRSSDPKEHDRSEFEIYDYPGEYQVNGDGESYVRTRLEEQHAQHQIHQGAGDARGLAVGSLFELVQHPREDQDGEYLVTAATHWVEAASYGVGGGDSGPTYSNRFSCIPSAVPYRLPRSTPKPVVQGPQTAIVTGPSGEEIHTDEHGRVKVQFHWDRYGGSDENSSCWTRVAQVWAGQGWGGIHLPRIGQEVIVEFLEGDPDRPIVTGRVYNGANPVPYELPANKTQSGIKSRSSKGGGPENFNEIRFEDKKGEEELYFHAEKNQAIEVENDRNEHTGHDRSLVVDHDKTEEVGNDKTLTIGHDHTEAVANNMSISVGSNLTETIAVNYAETVGAAMELTIGGVFAQSVGGNKTEAIGVSKTETIGKNKSVTVGSDMTVEVAKNTKVEIGEDYEEKVGGKHKKEIEKEFMVDAQKIQLTAKDEISFKCGKAEIVLKKNGDITIKGKKINVKGSGDVTIKGSKIKGN